MQTLFFNKVSPDSLIGGLRKQITRIADNGAGAADAGKERMTAWNTYVAYAYKDDNGNPVPGSVTPDEQNDFIDVELSGAEARDLNLPRLASLSQLYRLTRGEATAHVGQRSLAAHILASGVRNYVRYKAHAAKIEADYGKAVRAFDAIIAPQTPVAPPDPADAKLLAHKTALAEAVETFRASHPGQPVLLTRDEQSAICDSVYRDVDPDILSDAQQKERQTALDCAKDIQAAPEYKGRVVAQWDPALMRDVEAYLRIDKTGAWLLGEIKKGGIPAAFFEHVDFDRRRLAGERMAGACFVSKNQAITAADSVQVKTRSNYIALFTNYTPAYQHAAHYGHEGRHYWQLSVYSPKESYTASPIDKIVIHLLREADAQAVGNKIAWHISRKLNKTMVNGMQAVLDFENTVSRPDIAGLTPATRLRKATQASFVAFIRNEFRGLGYIKSYLDDISLYGDMDMWARALRDSKYLKPENLKRLSQVGEDAFYLDDAGLDEIRRLIIDGLPRALDAARAPKARAHSPLMALTA